MNGSFYENEESRRVADLLQRYFEGTISLDEAEELITYWDAHPDFDDFARKNREIDQVLRFFSDLQKKPLVYGMPERRITLEATGSPFSYSSGSTTEKPSAELPDLDELIRLAANIQTLHVEWHSDSEPTSCETKTQAVWKEKTREKTYRALVPTKYLVLLLCVFFIPLIYQELRTLNKASRQGGTVQAPQRVKKASIPRQVENIPATATLVDIANVAWKDEKNVSISLGTPFYSDRLHFSSGTLELLFFSGVRCIVEGPADFTLVDRKQIFAHQGSFSVEVPPQGKQFEIRTPRYLIRDLGTRFQADIDTVSGKVQVLEGTVEVEGTEADRHVVLEEKQAVRILKNGRIEPESIDFSRYISTEEMRRRSGPLLKFASPLLVRRSLGSRTPVFQLDPDHPDHSIKLFGCETVEGRTPETKAFRFLNKNDRIRLRLSGPKESLSGIAWIRVDRLLPDQNPILVSEGALQGGFFWKITGNGTILFGWRYRKWHSVESIESPIVPTEEFLGRWIQLAFTYDVPNRLATVYMNGQPLVSETMAKPTALSLDNLDLGNWKTNETNEGAFQPLDGAIAEFELYTAPLTSIDIRSIYESSLHHDRSAKSF